MHCRYVEYARLERFQLLLVTQSKTQLDHQPTICSVCLRLDAALLVALSAAFVLGVEHSFEPDHIVAVSTIATQSRGLGRSLLTGSLWGLGHTLALLVAGMLVILLRVQLPLNISAEFEFLVGIMLLLLGLWTVVNLKRKKLHFHAHSHDGKLHAHLHSHRDDETHNHPHVPLSVGVVHGLAGSGALVVLVMSTMAGVFQGLAFIAAFGVGLIVAMSLISSMLSLPVSFGGRFAHVTGFVFQAGAGCLSLALGVLVLVGYFF